MKMMHNVECRISISLSNYSGMVTECLDQPFKFNSLMYNDNLLKLTVTTFSIHIHRMIIKKLMMNREIKAFYITNYNQMKLTSNLISRDGYNLIMNSTNFTDISSSIRMENQFKTMITYGYRHYMLGDIHTVNLAQICRFTGCAPFVSETDCPRIIGFLLCLMAFEIPMPSRITNDGCQYFYSNGRNVTVSYNNQMTVFEIITEKVVFRFDDYRKFFEELQFTINYK